MSSARIATQLRERADVLLAFDPGLNQLVLALGVMAGVSVSIGAMHLLVLVAHPGPPLLAMLLGGLIGMLSAFAVTDRRPRDLAITMTLLPVPMLAAMALSIQFTGHRTLGILVMAIVMGLGAYVRRFIPQIGPRAFVFGQMLFVGYLFGFLSGGAVKSSDLGWIALVLWVAAAVNFLLRALIFAPLGDGALRRTLQAFFARSRGVIVAAERLFDSQSDGARRRAQRRLRKRLTRLNEVALIVDGLLGEHVEIADDTHARLFQTELTVQNIGRIAGALAEAPLPADVRGAIAASLGAARVGDGPIVYRQLEVLQRFGTDAAAPALEAGRVLRLADSLVAWKIAVRRWRRRADRVSESTFTTPVALAFGNLPGSAVPSSDAAAPPGSLRERFRLDSQAQSALRLAVTVGLAAAAGSLLSERRFYWAVLAVFVAYMGTNTSGEQVIKAGHRVIGTVVGILIGSLLAHAVGASSWSILVIVLALGVGIYFMRASYPLMVVGITICVSQLYVQLGEFSNQLLELRLEETAIGAGVAAVAALVVFPSRTRSVARVAAGNYYAQLGEMLDRLSDELDPAAANGHDQVPLSTLSRGLDNAAHQLRSAAQPLTITPFRRDEIQHNVGLFAQASHHARNVAADVQRDLELGPRVREAAAASLRTQRALVGTLQHERPAQSDDLRRQGDLLGVSLDHLGRHDERRLLRHIARLDETLAELGDNLSRRAG